MKNIKFLIFSILLIHLILLIFLRFTAWPEMILWPYLLKNGWLPYRDIVTIYPPVLILSTAFLGKLFGISLLNLKVSTWALILLTDCLVYWVAKKITKSNQIAFLSLLFYVFWQPFFEGNGLWFDLALVPLAFLSFSLLYQKKFFGGGVLFALAVLVKQTALYFSLPILLIFWLARQLKPKPILKFLSGVSLPFIFCLFYLLIRGLWSDFYLWVIDFAVFYLPQAPGQTVLPTIKQILAFGVPYAFCLLALTLLVKKQTPKEEKKFLFLLLAWSFFGVLGAYPRFEYFHFQPSLPFLAIISGLILSRLIDSWKKKKINRAWLLYLLLILAGIIHLQGRFYCLHWQKPDRFFEKETLIVADWIKKNTNPLEKIYVLNSWDHIYALSNTLPAVSPLIPTLPWHYEYPGIQEKFIVDLEKNKPRIVVFEPYKEKGLGSYKPEKIDRFLQENYLRTKIIAGRFWILEPQ